MRRASLTTTLGLLCLLAASPAAWASKAATLERAVQRGDLEKVLSLLESGVPVSVENPRYGTQAINWAVFADNPEMVRVLLEAGADPDYRPPSHSAPPLYQASSPRVVALLLEYGAEPLHPGMDPVEIWRAALTEPSVLQVLREKGVDPDTPDDRGQTALHRAAAGGHTDVVALLLSQGADPLAVDHEGQTALDLAPPHQALQRLLFTDGGPEALVQRLRAQGLADPDPDPELWRANGYVVSMFAGAPDGDVYVGRTDDTGAPRVNRIAHEGANVWQADPSHPIHWIGVGADGTVYGVGTDVEGDSWMSAFEAQDGAARWTVPYPDQPGRPPVVGEGAVYLTGSTLTALSTVDGGTLWQAAIAPLHGPVIDRDGFLYVSATEGLLSIDADGKQRWAAEGYGWSVPALAKNGSLYTTLPDAEGYARPRVLDSATGEVLERPEDLAGCADESFMYGIGAWDTGLLLEGGRMFQTSGAWGASLCAWQGAADPADGPWVRAGGDAGSARMAR